MSQEILDLERQQQTGEIDAARLDAEARFTIPDAESCPWGCDGSGWREIDYPNGGLVEYEKLLPDGRVLTPCECNAYRTWHNGIVRLHIRREAPVILDENILYCDECGNGLPRALIGTQSTCWSCRYKHTHTALPIEPTARGRNRLFK